MMISVHVFGLVTSKEESKKNIKLKNILILILFAILHTIINLYLDSSIKTLAICLLYTMYFYIIFDKKVYKSIFSSVLYIILLIIPDLLTLTIITKILNMSKECYHIHIAGSILGNIIISIIMIIMVCLLRKPIKKVVNYKLSRSSGVGDGAPGGVYWYCFVDTGDATISKNQKYYFSCAYNNSWICGC